jgi:hypothetical protein
MWRPCLPTRDIRQSAPPPEGRMERPDAQVAPRVNTSLHHINLAVLSTEAKMALDFEICKSEEQVKKRNLKQAEALSVPTCLLGFGVPGRKMAGNPLKRGLQWHPWLGPQWAKRGPQIKGGVFRGGASHLRGKI